MSAELNNEYDCKVKDVYETIKKAGLKCLLCKQDDWYILVNDTDFRVLDENCDWNTQWKTGRNIKLECTHCGFVMEFNPAFFGVDTFKRSFKKSLRQSNELDNKKLDKKINELIQSSNK